MMSRKFTVREKVLMVILAVLLLCSGYSILVAQPVEDSILDSKNRQEDAQSQIMVAAARVQQLAQMKASLAAIAAAGDDAPAQIPDYDNVQNVVQLLNDALSTSGGYNLVFSPVTFSGRIASRAIDMTFTCSGYAAAKDIVSRLADAPYRCQITGLTLLTDDGTGDLTSSQLSAKVTIIFYEYTQEAAAEESPSS